MKKFNNIFFTILFSSLLAIICYQFVNSATNADIANLNSLKRLSLNIASLINSQPKRNEPVKKPIVKPPAPKPVVKPAPPKPIVKPAPPKPVVSQPVVKPVQKPIEPPVVKKVIDAYATWCKPCMKMKPIFERVKAELGSKYTFEEADVDRTDVADKYDVNNLPTLIFLKDNVMVGKKIGAVSSDQELRNLIYQHLGK